MQNQIIPIFNSVINQEEVKSVNAKLLHSFLEVDTRFNDWIIRRINDYQFIENIDFVLVTQKRVIKNRGGDRRSKDYHITLDMAKELAMIERTEKGRQARKYFIECEKRLMQILHPTTINTEQQQAIKQAVNERSFRTGEHYQAIYTKLYEQFKIPRYQDLLASKFDEAIKWLGGVTKTRKDMIEVNRTNLICLVHHMIWLNDFYIDNRLYDVFKMLGSNFGVRLHDHFGDGAFVASMFKQQLEKKQLQKL
ncbi:phage antirepressor Ant [Gilliamella sp. Pra-s65]|uniref:antA/AntB antirepressor family protein n=1 Tax=unclassified Gilliamella TaxID=2685620 RepID=UPI001366171F|nr:MULTISPECIES: antA/AntB antirepressor family protein [unclassified Gilliamella]MWN91345.1 phage antirepressor Ant [Gilliamella sp. Pra-s65]MWP73606.1 phage antirepressor Ant [Gilliamella sp. Pra-s52]